MDPNTLQKIVQDRVAALGGDAFQAMCDRLASELFPGDYTRVRAAGPKGDTSNDGYCPKARVFFAAHATRSEPIAKTKQKIRSDLEGCLRKHRNIKIWRYLTNDTLIGEVEQYIDNELRPAHPGVIIETWGHIRVADEISKLSPDQINKILDVNLSIKALKDPMSEVISTINDLNIQVLIVLNLHAKKEAGPQLRLMLTMLKSYLEKLDAVLPTVQRTFGDHPKFYTVMAALSAEIRDALNTRIVMDGGNSDRARMGHLDAAEKAGFELLGLIRSSVSIKIEDFEPHISDVLERLIVWLSNTGYNQDDFFEHANTFSFNLLRIYLLALLSGDEKAATEYKQLADDIEEMSWLTGSGTYDLVDRSIKDFQNRAKLMARNLGEAQAK